jgi:hypothetical protein
VLKKSDKVHIRAELSDYTGKDMLSIREWVNTKNGWTRTAKGITISPEKGMIFCKSLLEAIQSLCGDV